MGKRVTVMLFGKMIRKGVQIEADATEGATVGKDLRWPSGAQVTEADIRNPGGTTPPTTPTNNTVLWSLILGIPKLVLQLAGLTKPGYLYHNGTDLLPHEHPLHDTHVAPDEILTIPTDKQYIIWDEMNVDLGGELIIDPGGELILLDEGLPEPKGPAFTYSSGDLSQVDYDAGEQKIFTYNVGGELERLDFIRDGLTFRKDFFYTVDGDLDYVNEYYV